MDRFTSDNYIGKSGICASYKTLKGNSDTHSHEFFELEYIIGGEGSYTLDGKTYDGSVKQHLSNVKEVIIG